MTKPPLSDVDQLAEWLHNHAGNPMWVPWSTLPKARKQRNRVLARHMLQKPPEILKRYVMEVQ